MPAASAIEARFPQLTSDQLRATVANFLPKGGTSAERIATVEAGLRSTLGQSMRDALAKWIVDEIVPVERLVPEAYVAWRPPVRDAMMFVVARLSPARLAPKLLEQLELPESTSAEERLLRLIAKVPGLQKLGQVIARNRHLRPALRNALARLENGIRDVKPEDMRAIIQHDLGPQLKKFDVRIDSAILSEASVSAVVRFTWHDPETGRRERGVFKILKPHIPEYFAEDMDYLQALAQYFGDRSHNYGFPVIPDTFKKVRRLLQHEVNFAREQKTLLEAANLYRNLSKVRVPKLIQPLCTPGITALTHERGSKVTNAATRLSPARRQRLGEQLIEALVAFPLLSAQEDVIFHGDPHAGNLLYNNRTGELTIIDWALRERLSRDQRRHLALLFAMVGLRDPVGTCNEVLALSQQRIRNTSPRGMMIAETVTSFLDELPAARLPGMVDAMLLLERIAMKGVKFPGSLIMLSKVMFTLDGILRDIGGSETGMNLAIVRHLTEHWISDRKSFRSPLMTKDWITLQCSALLYTTRLWVRYEKTVLDRLLPAASSAPLASA
jgi:ubiquinone biosynthesis protein